MLSLKTTSYGSSQSWRGEETLELRYENISELEEVDGDKIDSGSGKQHPLVLQLLPSIFAGEKAFAEA